MADRRVVHNPVDVGILRGVSLVSKPITLPARRTAACFAEGPHPAARIADTAASQAVHVSPPTQDTSQSRYQEGYETGYRKATEDLTVQAQREGFDAGYKHGLEKAEQQVATELLNVKSQLQAQWEQDTTAAAKERQLATQRLSDLIHQLSVQFAERLASCEDDIVELGFSVACAVLGRELLTPEGVRALLVRALQQWNSDSDFAVHLHPDDLTTISDKPIALNELVKRRDVQLGSGNDAVPNLPKITWVADDTLDLGGCLLVSPKGSLDARLTTVLDALKTTLLDVRSQRVSAARPIAPPEDASADEGTGTFLRATWPVTQQEGSP